VARTSEWRDRPSLFTAKSPVKNVFEKAREKVDQNVTVETDDIEAATMARAFEEKRFRFYQDLADRAKAVIERRFYQQCAYEERGHLLVFQDIHKYGIDPVHWYSKKERLHWNLA
jgi:rubrerythrin